MAKLADEIWRDYVTDGVPSSGAHKPIKADIRDWGLLREANRIVITSPLTLYVSTAGNDTTGDGTVGLPFATPDRAYEEIQANYDISNVGATIQMADGSYTLTISGPVASSDGRVTFKGNTADATAVVFYAASGGAVSVSRGCDVIFDYVKFDAPAGTALGVALYARARVEKTCVMGRGGTSGTVHAHFYASRFGYLDIQAGYRITGSAGAHFNCTHSGNIRLTGTSNTVTDYITVDANVGVVYFIFVQSSAAEVVISNMGNGSGYWGTFTVDSPTYPCLLMRLEGGYVQWATGVVWPTWPPGLVNNGPGAYAGGRFNSGADTTEMVYYDATAANYGPNVTYRRLGNPDLSKLTRFVHQGDDSAGSAASYAIEDFEVEDWTTASQDARKITRLLRAGALSTIISYGNGVIIGAPTGSYKGVGTLNASAVYDDNVLLSCFVFDQWLDGKVDFDKWDNLVPNRLIPIMEEQEIEVGIDPKSGLPIVQKVMAESGKFDEAERLHEPMRKFVKRIGTDHDPLTLDGFEKHIRDKRHLPAFPNEAKFDAKDGQALGSWQQQAIETMETMAVLIAELNQRTKAQQAKIDRLLAGNKSR